MGSLSVALRPAHRTDASQIAAIYAPIVRETAISFEIDPPSDEEIALRIATIEQRYPWLVAASGETVLGYAYASEYRQRAAYRWSVEVTAYVAETARSQGIGRQLYIALISVLRAQGFHSAFGGITLPNQASVALHEAVGFAPLGIYRDVGFKLGKWRDVGWWSLIIGPPDIGQPAEPVSFADFRKQPGLSDLLR
jgi:L-amino acid N-acyltransferase YncA